MRSILHILTRPNDPLPRDLIARQSTQPDTRIEVLDLTAPEPDYAALVQKVFAADSVQVW